MFVYFYIVVTFLQWKSAAFFCKEYSVCQEHSCFTRLHLESVFSKKKKKKSRFISTHLSDHEGKIGWGPCDESAKLIKHILLILLGVT